DFNGDGSCNIIDFSIMLFYMDKPMSIASRYDLNNDAKIDIVDNDGLSALMMTIEFFDSDSYFETMIETVKALIENGANINLQSKDGWTPLMMAVRFSDDNIYFETVKILSKPRVMSTEESRRNNTQGKIKLIVEFMANEKIGLVFALQTLPDGLTENCIAAAQQIKFKSEKKNGKPISVVKIIEYSFTLY
ncbi:MAG: ankyrin repeat domain-containing protein, partial [Acidobacteriota bacterium]